MAKRWHKPKNPTNWANKYLLNMPGVLDFSLLKFKLKIRSSFSKNWFSTIFLQSYQTWYVIRTKQATNFIYNYLREWIVSSATWRGTCSFICQGISTKRQWNDLFSLRVMLPPVITSLTSLKDKGNPVRCLAQEHIKRTC